ncbi:CcdB family protein [Brenneria tiliae]|uniref:CcdB family protein n=1 Tax=Brenneria tiliae TaxID=2914984 RepID=UPI002014CF09|nr:CcdB family protein [Brenneria tiliae]MCL2896263.1 CcdB family protein [Brenneria tiliae]MCL2900797.1 CcdB family protein [Brenneria tiliae]
MSQFDIYRNPSAKSNQLWPYYLVIQHDYFDDLSTRLIVPLVSKHNLTLNQKRITPIVNVNGGDYYVFTPAMTFLEARKIHKMDFVCSAILSRGEILSAFDAILTNT